MQRCWFSTAGRIVCWDRIEGKLITWVAGKEIQNFSISADQEYLLLVSGMEKVCSLRRITWEYTYPGLQDFSTLDRTIAAITNKSNITEMQEQVWLAGTYLIRAFLHENPQYDTSTPEQFIEWEPRLRQFFQNAGLGWIVTLEAPIKHIQAKARMERQVSDPNA